MNKKDKENLSKSIVYAIIIIFIVIICGKGCADIAETTIESKYEQQKSEQDQIVKEWQDHKTLMNNDLDKLQEIFNKHSDPKTTSDISKFVAEASPRLSMYKTHLLEARSFMNVKGDVFLNKLELKQQIDDKIVWVDTFVNEIDVEINEINTAVENYNSQREALLDILDLMV